jgi:hypothetical protein
MTNFAIDMYVYVDPKTREVRGMYLFGGLGAQARLDGDWEPVNRQTDPNMEDFARSYVTYAVDFEKGGDEILLDEEDDEFEYVHPLVRAFDEGEITEEMVKKYADLVNGESGNNPV